MRRRTLMIIGLMLATAGPLNAGTFGKSAIAPDLGLDAITRGVTREQVGRDLFSNPWATVTISHVDVYDRFPYLETRQFEIVSDPGWSRLVFGEAGRTLAAYDGRSGALGALKEPRGMAVDENDRVYVADAGNDRVVVLQASTEFDRIDLVPVTAIGGLSGPYAVAYSDGGTPFRSGDDMLYVADTGKNRVVAFALESGGARPVAAIGDLGSGEGRFAGPMAIAAGRADGVNTADLYVADAHNRRIVRLRYENGALRWIGETRQEGDIVTSLDTDQWGNVYAAAPNQGVVRKYNSDLAAVAELRSDVSRPRDFHVPFANIRDHRDGSVTRVGQPSGVSVDEWSDQSGVRLWSLGVEIDGLGVTGGDRPAAQFTLTDRAALTLEIADAADGHVVTRRSAGTFGAGAHSLPLTEADLNGTPHSSDLVMRLSAASSYANGPSDVAQASFRTNAGGSIAAVTQPTLLGSWPNPARATARLSFVLPSNPPSRLAFGVYDAQGRRVRSFGRAFAPGLNEIVWDGRDDAGRPAKSGIYFYRLDADDFSTSRSLVYLR